MTINSQIEHRVRHRYDLLVFDWDGTLMDSTSAIARSLQNGFRDVGLPAPSLHDCNYVIGYGLKEAMLYLTPDSDEAEVVRLVDAYKHHFFSGEQKLALFDGVIEALPRLREAGYTLAIATGKARAGLNRMLEMTGIGDFFEVTRCADEAFSKPHPAMLEYILDYTVTDAGRALMIGDTTHDLQLAINAGTHSAALTYGAHPLEEMLPLKPVAHFDDFPSLAGWLLQEDVA
ncbi:MAG: HAD-IA family hydrolase [Formivibrio sp.]|nr:HAD-IA family hydrolase [Formivibrio sp.]